MKKFNFYSTVRISASAIAIGMLSVGLSGCGDRGEKAAAPRAIAVRLRTLESATLTDSSEYVGSLQAKDRVSLAPRIEGRISEIFVRQGDRVQRGEPIVRLEPTQEQEDVNAATQNVNVERARLGQVEAELRTAQANRAAAAAEVESARADLEDAEAEVELAQINIERTRSLVEGGALAQQNTQSILAKATFANQNSLKDREYAPVRVIWNESPGVLVPTVAVSSLAGQNFVYVATEENQNNSPEDSNSSLVVQQRTVNLGSIQNQSYQVISSRSR